MLIFVLTLGAALDPVVIFPDLIALLLAALGVVLSAVLWSIKKFAGPRVSPPLIVSIFKMEVFDQSLGLLRSAKKSSSIKKLRKAA